MTSPPISNSPPVSPNRSRRRGNSRLSRVMLLAFIISPLAVLTVLCVLIKRSIEHGTAMHEPAVGAGAGKTGMTNEFMGIGKQPKN